MTREQAKDIQAIIQAYAEGKTIQRLRPEGFWEDYDNPSFTEEINIDKYGESAPLGDIAYIHELQQALSEERNFIGNFNLEWKGIEKK